MSDVELNDNAGTGTYWDRDWDKQKNMWFLSNLICGGACFVSEKLGQTGTSSNLRKLDWDKVGQPSRRYVVSVFSNIA